MKHRPDDLFDGFERLDGLSYDFGSDAVGHPLRSLNTLRYLHASQIVNRAVRTVDPLTAIPAAGAVLLLPRAPVRPAEEPAGVFDGNSFSFLNRRAPFAGTDRWHPAGGCRG